MVNVDKLNNVCIYVDEQKLELPEQSEIRCLPGTNQIEVRSFDDQVFRLSVSDHSKNNIQVAVPKGKKVQVVLADESRIVLRERSKLIFPLVFAPKERLVNLQGEAYMKISHHPERPFITATDQLKVSVLGTEFLVSAYPNRKNQSVLLVSGKVAVQPEGGEQVMMSPHQLFTYNATNNQTILERDIDPQKLIGWKENILMMNNQSMSDVLKQIESIYSVGLNYDSNELKSIILNGKLDLTVNLEQLLERLTKIAPINVSKEQKRIIITKTK